MRPNNLLPNGNQKKEKTYVSDSTKFKLCVYYSHKPNGVPYSIVEINTKRHRHYHDSKDYKHTTSGKTVTRHDEAFNKLLRHVKKHEGHIISALLFVNDFIEGKQHLIGKFFPKDADRDDFVMPVFTEDELGMGHIYYAGLTASPIETTDIQTFILKKQIA